MLASAFGRMIMVSMAFVVAAAAALFVFVTLGLERVTQAVHGERGEAMESAAALFEFVWQAYLLVSALTLLPALAVVLIGEVARIRSVLYYVVGGGAALTVFPLAARLEPPEPAAWQVLATAGIAGGFVYWLLAGRRA